MENQWGQTRLIFANWEQITLPFGTLISIESDPIDSGYAGIAAEIRWGAKLLPDECFSTRT